MEKITTLNLKMLCSIQKDYFIIYGHVNDDWFENVLRSEETRFDSLFVSFPIEEVQPVMATTADSKYLGNTDKSGPSACNVITQTWNLSWTMLSLYCTNNSS